MEQKIKEIINKKLTRKQFLKLFGISIFIIPFLTKDILAKVFLRDENSNLYELSSLGKSSIVYVIDGGGEAISTGIKGDIKVPFNGQITSCYLLADQSGSIVVDLWKDIYTNFPPTDADSITSSAVPTISSTTKDEDTSLTGWTKTITAGDIIRFNVDSCTTIERCTVILNIRKT